MMRTLYFYLLVTLMMIHIEIIISWPVNHGNPRLTPEDSFRFTLMVTSEQEEQ